LVPAGGDGVAGGGDSGGGAVAVTSLNSALDEVWILVSGLGSTEPPAAGQDGVSYLDYTPGGQVAVTFVDWSGALVPWYRDAPGYLARASAYAEHHLALLHRPDEYAIHDRGGADDLSGSPTTYKESLAVSGAGFGWTDYGELGADGSPTALTSVVFQTWDGNRRVLTDDLRYRTALDASETHLTYVEYAEVSEGASGQVMVASVDGARVFAVAPGPHHQDHPRTDGNWVVWEEFVTPTEVMIRAFDLTTETVRDLTDAAAYRTQPDVRGALVVWEDHRSGNGDIHLLDLSAANPAEEQLLVGEPTHSTGPRLVEGGLVWLEAHRDRIELRFGLLPSSPG
jgi:beta propeller repeat protein